MIKTKSGYRVSNSDYVDVIYYVQKIVFIMYDLGFIRTIFVEDKLFIKKKLFDYLSSKINFQSLGYCGSL